MHLRDGTDHIVRWRSGSSPLVEGWPVPRPTFLESGVSTVSHRHWVESFSPSNFSARLLRALTGIPNMGSRPLDGELR